MSALNFRAILAGAFGAGASCFAKLSFDSNSNLALAMRNICYSKIESVDESNIYNICEASSLLTRGLTLLLMVGCNVLMVGTFVEGMTVSGSTIATALSTGSNFVLSVRIFIQLSPISLVAAMHVDRVIFSHVIRLGCIWNINFQRGCQ